MAPQGAWTSNTRLFQRVGIAVIALFLSAAFTIFLVRATPSGFAWSAAQPAQPPKPPVYYSNQFTPGAPGAPEGDSDNPLVALSAKYAHLRDDKFTIAMQTYKRPEELKQTLAALTAEDIPSLHEIVIVWNNLEEPTPPDWVTDFGVKVRYRMSKVNSLNQKLIPDPDYQTKAILLTDDDVYYGPDDLEWVFRTWRNFGQFRLVGALPRCSDKNKEGKYEYNFCSNKEGLNHYTMVLTNLCFSHIAYLDYYSSDAPESIKIREYVDEHFNCEDIALNYMASKLTGLGPLEANGYKRYHNMDPGFGISRKPGHMEARSQCLNDFVEIFGYQPLVEETQHMVRGLTVL